MNVRSVVQWFGLCLALAFPAHADDQPRLYGRSSASPAALAALPLSDDDRRWLWSRRVLRLGVSQPDYPPFDLTGTGSEYEGISADYAALIGELLNLRVEVTRYGSRKQALQALQHEQIDLLGSSNGFEVASRNLVLSQAYVEDRAVLATRREPRAEPVMADTRHTLAMLEDYLPMAAVERLYPDTRVLTFASTLGALGAVAFGQADSYLGNAMAAHYQVAKGGLDNLQLSRFSRVAPTPFGFALSPRNGRLLALVNAALESITASERQLILRRWSAVGVRMTANQELQLSDSERDWIKRHPQVRLVINEQFLPISYRDAQGQYRGISADILERVSQRTGLSFDVVDSTSITQMMEQVKRGEVDLLAAIPPSPVRAEQVRFTRSYLTSSLVLVTREADAALNDFDALAEQPVALVAGSYVHDRLRKRYPRMRLLEARNSTQAMALVDEGKARAAVVTLIGARYMISQRYRESLRISAILPFEPANFAFATARGADELQGILNKALLSITPQEMDELSLRWHNEVIVADSFWQRYRGMLLPGLALVALLWVVALLWISYLRRLVRRRERAEQALTDQLEFMRVMIDGTPHPIYVRDRGGRLLTCNVSYLQALGVTREAVIGQCISEGDVLDRAQALRFHQEYLRVMERGEALVDDRQLTLANGEQLTLHHWVLPYRGSGGDIVGMIAGWIDVSERQRLCEAFQQSKESAEAASRAKTTFLASMSHEIRTPMNAVLGMLELALKKAERGVPDKLALEVASGAARSLLELIGDILDITRIESGHLALAPQSVAVRPLVESVVRLFDGQARHKRLSLVLDSTADGRLAARIDPVRFKQILSNLVSNAIKFTPQGEVRVQLELTLDGARVRLRVEVSDSGIGIPPHELNALGKPFSQASNNRQSTRTGCGLGLSISRTLCEMMGGRLDLASELGVGTRASIHLNLAAAEPAAGPLLDSPAPPAASRRLRVLVVDDYPANRVLLDQQLAYLGHHVCLACDGSEGLRLWLQGGFDVVISDCNMPGLNGYELAQAIREHERRNAQPPCLVLGCTANAQVEERKRCLAVGMDDCLFKPLSLNDLATHLGAIVGGTEPDEADRSRPPDAPAPAGDEPLIDLSSLRELTGANPAALRQLLGDLLTSSRHDIARIAELRGGDDHAAIASLAHRIKGAARMIRAQPLLDALEILEQACAKAAAADLVAPLDGVSQAMTALETHLVNHCGDTPFSAGPMAAAEGGARPARSMG